MFKNYQEKNLVIYKTKVFPTYFTGQTLAPIILGLAQPFAYCPFTLGLLALSSVGGALNYLWLLPVCQKIKRRQKQVDC